MENSDHIIETIDEDRRRKKCLCCVCGIVSECTPTNDFYSTKDHGEKLVCERCFHEYVKHKLNRTEND